MGKTVILSADSTCDVGPVIERRYQVQYYHFHIQVGEESYIDRVEISPEEIYASWRERGVLPKTAAITPQEYVDYFAQWDPEMYDVVHICLGSGLTSSYQNCVLAAEQLGHVYPFDSASLSTGSGHLVVKAGEMIRQGMTVPEIGNALHSIREKTNASFVLDTLEFMKAGGRCSAVAAFGANLLQIKPGILVNNREGGKMGVGKKYRGSMEKVLREYVRDKLADREDIDSSLLFITHSGSPDSDVELVRRETSKYVDFDEVLDTRASGTISSHCGPRTLGVLFMTK